MEITVEMSGKTPRSYGGRTKWGVHPKGSPDGYWVDIYVNDRPKPGQVFNIGAVKEDRSADGKRIFREAEIIGPAMATLQRPAQPAAILPKPGGDSYGNSTTAPAPSNGKIKWDDWVEIARAAHELAVGMEPEPGTNGDASAARLAFVNTTLIAFSNGKLELPTDAGPVSWEPGGGDPYANPDAAPWRD